MMIFNALSLQELIKENNPVYNERALNCKFYSVKYRNRWDRFVFYTRCFESYSNPLGHVVSIKFNVKSAQTKKYERAKNLRPNVMEAKLMCSCESFLYNGSKFIATMLDYLLAGKEIRYPVERDPELKNYVCKHVALISLDILDNKKIKNLDYPVMRENLNYKSSMNEISEYEAVQNLTQSSVSVDIEKTFPIITNYLIRNGVHGYKAESFISLLNEDNYGDMTYKIGLCL